MTTHKNKKIELNKIKKKDKIKLMPHQGVHLVFKVDTFSCSWANTCSIISVLLFFLFFFFLKSSTRYAVYYIVQWLTAGRVILPTRAAATTEDMSSVFIFSGSRYLYQDLCTHIYIHNICLIIKINNYI